MGNISVSIIVPIYNVESYLGACLDSLEHQTKTDLEVIMVNDGSTDNSGEIARKYEARNKNFMLINQENRGLSIARNVGLKNAGGEYVLFLDSDDFLAENAAERLYETAKEENLDQLRFAAYTFDDGTEDYKWVREVDSGYKYLGDYRGVYTGREFYRKAIDNNDYYPSCCLIFTKRSVIEVNKLRFYEGILHEDNLFNFQLTTLCERVAVMNEPLYYRRNRCGSITTSETNWLHRTKSMCVSAEEADKFIEEHPQIKGEIAEWQIMFFANMMFWQWDKLTREEQDSHDAREYFERIRPLIEKYGNGGGKSLRIFYISYPLYRVYKRLRLMLTKYIGTLN